MEQAISKEEYKKLMAIEGSARGVTFKNYEDFIIKEKGKDGIKKIEEALLQLGYPKKYSDFQDWEFYPVGLEAVVLLLMQRIFGFSDEKIWESGFASSRAAFIIKIFLSHFVSIKMFAKQAPEMWKRFYTTGELKIKEMDDKKKYAVLTIENFSIHPLHCIQLMGYLCGIVEMIAGSKATCEETKCIHQGDDHHEFLIKY